MLSELAFPHIRCCLSAIPSDLMKSTAVDEMNQQFCSRENQLLQIFHFIYYIYIAHLESCFFVDFQMSLNSFSFSSSGHFFHTVSFDFFLKGSHPLLDQLPGEHTGLPYHTRQYLFFIWPFNAVLICTLTQGR